MNCPPLFPPCYAVTLCRLLLAALWPAPSCSSSSPTSLAAGETLPAATRASEQEEATRRPASRETPLWEGTRDPLIKVLQYPICEYFLSGQNIQTLLMMFLKSLRFFLSIIHQRMLVVPAIVARQRESF